MNQERLNYRWTILGICWLGYVVALMQRLSIGPLAPFLKEGLSISNAQIGMFTTAVCLGYMIALLPGGILVDKVGEKLILVISEVIGGLFICGMFFVTAYYQGFILMLLCGFGLGSILPATSKAIMTWFPERERATAMGIKHTAINIGGVIGSATLPAISLALSWQHSFFIIGMLGVVIGIISFLFYKPHPMTAGAGNTADKSKKKSTVSLKNVFKNKNIILVSFVGACASIEFAVITYFVLFLTEDLKYTVVAAGFILAVLEAGGALGKPVLGFISDRILKGSRKKAYFLIAATWCFSSLTLAFFKEGQPLFLLLPICIIMGASCLGWSGIHFTFVAELAGKDLVGSATAVCTIIAALLGLMWPPLIGWIIDVTGSYTMSWLVVSGSGALAFLLLLFIREDKK